MNAAGASLTDNQLGGSASPVQACSRRRDGAGFAVGRFPAVAVPTVSSSAGCPVLEIALGDNLLGPSVLSQAIGWQPWLQRGSAVHGTNSVSLLSDGVRGTYVEFTRRDGGRDGGAAGLIRPLDLAVGTAPLYVRLVGSVLSEQGGNLANANPRWYPEGAVQVRIKYLTAAEQELEWYHGFYAQPVDKADTEHFTQVTQGRWFTYVSLDLMTLPKPPRFITELRVYGFGWEFQGWVSEVSLTDRQTGTTGSQPSATPRSGGTVPGDRDECQRLGGRWGRIGVSPMEQCNLPTADGGRMCADTSECESACIASLSKTELERVSRGEAIVTKGNCSAWKIVVGCLPIVTGGRVRAVTCMD